MKYVDPATNPNLWLEMTLIKLIEENKPENVAVIKQALHVIIHWLEPGLIDQLFGDWIQQYQEGMCEHKNNQNTIDHQCSLKGRSE